MTEFPIANPQHVQQPLIQATLNDLRGGHPAPSNGETVAGLTRLRKVLAHEYLDVKYPNIERFVAAALAAYTPAILHSRRTLECRG